MTVREFIAMKNKQKITMLTAYEYLTASILDRSGIDAVLVGDSLGMVFQGIEETLPVTVDEIIYHTKAVKRGIKKALIIADMPFMSYQASVSDAKRAAGRIMKESGAGAVKLEGGAEIADTVRAIVEIGVPVMGHIGLQPQSVHKYGGYVLQGADDKEKARLIEDAKALEKAGAFSIVIEKVKSDTGKAVTKAVNIPVIGIGAGKHTDGQVLVSHDMLGFFTDFKPKFVRQYSKLGDAAQSAVKKYISDVKAGKFPSKKESF